MIILLLTPMCIFSMQMQQKSIHRTDMFHFSYNQMHVTLLVPSLKLAHHLPNLIQDFQFLLNFTVVKPNCTWHSYTIKIICQVILCYVICKLKYASIVRSFHYMYIYLEVKCSYVN